MMSRPLPRRPLLRKKNTYTDRNTPIVPETTHRFDETTGQIYIETMVSMQSGDDTNWARKPRPNARRTHRKLSLSFTKAERRKDAKESLNENGLVIKASRGARSLHDIAIDTTIQNLDETSLNVLECVPIPVLERIWNTMNKNCAISFELWKIFSRLVNQNSARASSLLRYSDIIYYPRSPLNTYLQPLTSNSFDFITCISITAPFSTPDLVKLSKVRNLGILEVVGTSSNLLLCTDSVVRAWGIAASEDGAFPVLRILRLLSHQYVTNKSLLYLNNFPALGVYAVASCGFDGSAKTEARSLGWQLTADNVLTRLERACVERLEPLRNSFGINKTLNLSIPSRRDLKSTKEEHFCSLFDKIGELRNDSDLRGAGIVVDTPVSIEEGFVSSIPLVKLGLGPSSELRNVVSFIRIQLPVRSEDQAKSIQGQREAKNCSRFVNGSKAISAIPKNRKRRLEDILNSFT